MFISIKLLLSLWPLPLSFITTAVCGMFAIILGLPAIENLYIAILLKIFQFSDSILKRNSIDDSKKEEEDQINNNANEKQDNLVIERDIVLTQNEMRLNKHLLLQPNFKVNLFTPTYFIKSGVESIIEDEVTQRFKAADLPVWNMLSRTSRFRDIDTQLIVYWMCGAFVRYFIFLPVRLILAISAILLLAIMCFFISCMPKSKLQRFLYGKSIVFCFRLFVKAFSAVITFHDVHNRPKSDGICVANHTTPLDVVILGCDNVYALVGQRHGGFIGFMQRVFSSGESHIWFDRGETRDRQLVARRMLEHVQDPNKLPILVFPEGTCINNTSVMMFKKGSFEVGGVIYPVAVKYDPRFADCFWNSSRHSMVRHLFMMMTSWAIKADVCYLPPQHQLPNEDAIQFANRVKKLIAERGGFIDLGWDGGLKRCKPKETLKFTQQDIFFKIIKEA